MHERVQIYLMLTIFVYGVSPLICNIGTSGYIIDNSHIHVKEILQKLV